MSAAVAPEALVALRNRLVDMRDELVERLASDGIEPGFLPLVAGVTAALAALDAVPVDAVPADRAVLVDDGETMRLVSYSEASTVAMVALDPLKAIRLGNRLIDAGLRRL